MSSTVIPDVAKPERSFALELHQHLSAFTRRKQQRLERHWFLDQAAVAGNQVHRVILEPELVVPGVRGVHKTQSQRGFARTYGWHPRAIDIDHSLDAIHPVHHRG